MMASRLTTRRIRPPVAERFARADDGVRTRDPQLGKLMLYQLSYVRVDPRIAPSEIRDNACHHEDSGGDDG